MSGKGSSMRRTDLDHPDANFIAVFKGAERYIYVYADAARDDLVQVLARHAADPALSLTVRDAANARRAMLKVDKVADR